eukprot:1119300-Rhodomonas_salina.1
MGPRGGAEGETANNQRKCTETGRMRRRCMTTVPSPLWRRRGWLEASCGRGCLAARLQIGLPCLGLQVPRSPQLPLSSPRVPISPPSRLARRLQEICART